MPREPEPSWRDGMRSVQRDEFESLDALLSAVFRPGLVQQYPHLYSPENTCNMRVVVQDGRVVSHIGTIRRHASLLGCTVRVASLGGVSTYPEHRAKGHATALFEDWMRVCREDGGDFMLVSGYRKMYHRHGCRYVGKDFNYDLLRTDADRFDDAGVEVREATPEDAEALAEVYRREPVRWLRPPVDYRNALTSYVMNRPAQFLMLYERGALQGYVIVQMLREQDRERKVQVMEYAGDRRSVVGALGKVVKRYDIEGLRVHAGGWDRPMQGALAARGLRGTPGNASGTVTLIHFTQFMERMRPYFVERIGETEAGSLVFQERGEQRIFLYGGDRVVAEDRGEAAQLIFGTLEGTEEKLLSRGGRAGEVLRRLFPIPALWYGVNYV